MSNVDKEKKEVRVMSNLRAANETQAEANSNLFREKKVFAFNLLGSPGAGKTTLLEKTLALLKDRMKAGVIEGDLYSTKDADRIAKYNIPVVQINTSGGCHLDALMIAKVLPDFDLDNLDTLIVENVGNLVCPADFNLGEELKVVVLSIVEGDDKPAKYPLIFRNSAVAILNKMDLLNLTDVNMDNMKADILAINPKIKIFEVSCRQGVGLEEWCNWLLSNLKK
ncbi:MAG TPA: hydrogenase nickel incorporation protein HypB [Candidatus Deferrimicrobium sp.]|nr:hydrogenase nickel incorporation protein HypB [Candidatus Deferrimicrobium sp.]